MENKYLVVVVVVVVVTVTTTISVNVCIDWLILLKSKNLICSNSSFCYTAGWYSKEMVYQPDKFFTRYIKTDLHYPAFPYYKTQKTKIL